MACLEASTPVKKLHIHASQHLDANFVTPTPEKTDETLNVRCKKEPAKLLEKLLNLRKQLPTFQNICRQVETLTKREFSYRRLAQIKFIFPEVVQADKILLHNKKTLSMEPDIKVTLLIDVIEGHVEHSLYIALWHTFSIGSSSLSIHIQRHFSRKDVEESTKTELSPLPVSPSSITSNTTNNKEIDFSPCSDLVKHDKVLQVANEDTPMKPPLVLDEITIETPDLSTPKRSIPTKNKLKSVVSQKGMASNLFAKRSLDFSTADDEGEIEKQIELLVNKVPDWISKKVDPCGDFLYNINRGSDLKPVTERLT
ncbi:hypothetical protein L6452_36100 [Arctium lappa]|uniref:Uncharacterized protein n=1 Tax=Arctium lappa TaxID=4217 RepID=A0ACB8Y8Z4_ARCLA|nr:hypothetical protein L6452_36100 [Arctium lappa]